MSGFDLKPDALKFSIMAHSPAQLASTHLSGTTNGLTCLKIGRDNKVMESLTISPPLQDSKRGELMIRPFRELQVARFNELYYRRRARWFHFQATSANVIAALAASVVLANLLAANNKLFGWGPLVWQILTLLGAVFAAVGPVLSLENKIGQMEKAALGHSILKDRLQRLLTDLKGSELEESHLARDREIDAFGSALTPLDEAPSERLREQCWKETLKEYPAEQAWSLV